MSKKYFFFSGYQDPNYTGAKDGWVNHVDQVVKEGVNRDGVENCVKDTQQAVAVDGVGNTNTKRRTTLRDSAIGLDSDNCHYKGDRVVILAEQPQRGGDVLVTFERYDNNGVPTGTYEQPWHKVREGTHRMGTARRVRH